MNQKIRAKVLLVGAITLAVYACVGLWVRSESADHWAVRSGLLWGVKDKDGKVLLDAKYQDVTMHGDVVHLYAASGQGLASATGKILLEPKYASAWYRPHVGIATVCIEQGKRERCALAARDGQSITPFRFDSIELVGEGPFPFRDGAVHGYVDAGGKILNEGRFLPAGPGALANGSFWNGVALVEQNGKKVLIDRKFSVVYSPRTPLQIVASDMHGVAEVCEPVVGTPVPSKSGKPRAVATWRKCRLIDRAGRDLLPAGAMPSGLTIIRSAEGRPRGTLRTVVQGNKRGIVDGDGRKIVPVNYSRLYLRYASAGYIVAYTEAREMHVFDLRGRQVLRVEKDDAADYVWQYEDLESLKVNSNTGLIAFRSKGKWQVVEPRKGGTLMSADREIGLTNRPDRFIVSASDKSPVTYQLVDQSGTPVSAATFSSLRPVENEADALEFRSGATAGVLDHDGHRLFEISGWVMELPRSVARSEWTRDPGSGAYAFPSESLAMLAANKLSLLYGDPRAPVFRANEVLGVKISNDVQWRALVGAFLPAAFLFGWWLVVRFSENSLKADAGRLIRFLAAMLALTFLVLQTGSFAYDVAEVILTVVFSIMIVGYCAWRWRSWQTATRWLASTLLWPEVLIVLTILDQSLLNALSSGPVFFTLLILGLVALGAMAVYTARKSAATARA